MRSGVKDKFWRNKYFIPNGGCVEYQERKVPMDPYTMGLLIAEGAFTKFKKQDLHNKPRKHIQMSACKEDMEFY